MPEFLLETLHLSNVLILNSMIYPQSFVSVLDLLTSGKTSSNFDGMFVLFFFKIFCGDKSPFCGATGTLCFGLQLTLPMGLKARVDPLLPCSTLTCV